MALFGLLIGFLSAAPAVQAEVVISGDARMGLAFDSDQSPRAEIVNRIRIHLTVRGTTDGGLGYGIVLDDEPRSGFAARRAAPARAAPLSADAFAHPAFDRLRRQGWQPRAGAPGLLPPGSTDD